MIQALQKNDTLLSDIRSADVADGFAVWWLGQSGFLLKARTGILLFDPYLSDSLTRKYADTDKPHMRMTELAVDPARLDMVDVVTSTHNHTDHLDPETLGPLRGANPDLRMVIPEANRAFVADRLGCDAGWPVGLDAGERASVAGFTFHGIPAAHNAVDRDDAGPCRYLGYVVAFEGGCVYHSGDTLWHEQLVPALEPFDLDLAMVPINGYRPERRVAGNLFGDEAARLSKRIGARLAVPHHFEMFTFNTEPPELFCETCRELDQPCRVLRCGERLEVATA